MTKSILGFVVAMLVASVGARAGELTVFAAASLQDALAEIGSHYEQQSGEKIVFNFAASSTLARQIEQGVPADIFFSADEAKIDVLEKKGLLLPGTRRSLLSNTLAIVVSSDSRTVLKSARDLASSRIKRIAIAEPQTVPAGIYAREYLKKLGLWDALQDKLVPTENVRGALAVVEAGNVDAGIVYKTDALVIKRVKVALEISAAEGPQISYPVAVMKNSSSSENARRFVDHLAGGAARRIFEKFGFAEAK
jgi:molybdate transport system substrate-binding protein